MIATSINPGLAFKCFIHWDRPWMNRRIEAAYHQVDLEYALLASIVEQVPLYIAEIVQPILAGLSHEASYISWFGRAE